MPSLQLTNQLPSQQQKRLKQSQLLLKSLQQKRQRQNQQCLSLKDIGSYLSTTCLKRSTQKRRLINIGRLITEELRHKLIIFKTIIIFQF